MKIKLILIFILSFSSCARSQSKFNISAYDTQLHDIFNGLVATEKKIGSFLSNLNNFVDEFNGNFKSNKSRLFMDLSHLQLILQLQSSIGNYETYQPLTGCSNVASKISEIEVDLKKFSDFVDRLELNMTELYHRNLHVTYGFIMRFRQSNNSQQDMLDIILGVNEAIVQYLFYILQLQVNIQYEKSISTNLNYFIRSSCKCNDSPREIAQMTTGLPSSSDLEDFLLLDQARIASAANRTLIESQKLSDSKNVSGILKMLITRVSILSRKIRRINDYSNVTVPAATSCSSLSRVQNIYTYRRFGYGQVISFAATNTSVLKFYKSSILNISVGNSSIDQATNASIKSLTKALNALQYELINYAEDLKFQLKLSSLANIYAQYEKTLKSTCGCLENGTTDEGTTSGVTQKTNSMTSSAATASSKITTTSLTPNPTTSTKSSASLSTTTTTTIKASDSTTKLTNATSTTASSTTNSISSSTSLNTSSTPTQSTIPTTTPYSTTNSNSTSSRSTSSTTSSNSSSTTPKLPPTLPQTTSSPPLTSFCSFTKDLRDMTGNYIKSACLIEKQLNGSFAKSNCQDNSMQMMTIDSNMTQIALTIFIQETLSEGIFWIDGGNGSAIYNFVVVNESGLVLDKARCSWYDYYSICEYQDSKVPAKEKLSTNLDACGIVFPIMVENEKNYTRYACVMAYTRPYSVSSYNCVLNGMQMFSIVPNSVVKTINDNLVDFYGNNSAIYLWVNAPVESGSCSYLDGDKVPFAVNNKGNCEKLYWSICEAPYDGSY